MSDSQVPKSAQNISTEDETLQYTLDMRRRIVKEMTSTNIPISDPKSMGILLQTLDGMDRSALGQKKIKSEENIAGANQAMAATIIAELLQKSSSVGVKPFAVANPQPRPAPTLPADIPDPVLVEGEIGVSPPQLSYETFTKKYSPEE